MNQPQDDEKLIAFLQQHRPVPPPAGENAEQRLMTQLRPQLRPAQRRQLRLLWLLPGAVVAGLVWSLWQPQPAPQADALDAFMVSNWEGMTGVADPSTPEASWLLLNELDMELDMNPQVNQGE